MIIAIIDVALKQRSDDEVNIWYSTVQYLHCHCLPAGRVDVWTFLCFIDSLFVRRHRPILS